MSRLHQKVSPGEVDYLDGYATLYLLFGPDGKLVKRLYKSRERAEYTIRNVGTNSYPGHEFSDWTILEVKVTNKFEGGGPWSKE